MKRKKKKLDNATQFGKKIAKVMDDLKSSHIFFVIQQAYGDIAWYEAQEILDKVLGRPRKDRSKE